jgi:ribosomal protein S1
VAPALVPSELSPGDRVVGWVQEVGPDALWLSLGPAAKGRVHMFDACDAPRQLAGFQGRFKVGQALAAAVVAVDAKRQKLDLTLRADVAMRPHAAGEGRGGGGPDCSSACSSDCSSKLTACTDCTLQA